MTIQGGNYPAPPLIELLQRLLSYVQLIGMVWVVLGGEKLMNLLGYGSPTRPLPAFYWKIQEYGFQIMVGLYFILPQFLNSYLVSGAFEVYLNDQEIYSKLKTGSLPNMDTLASSLVQAGLKASS